MYIYSHTNSYVYTQCVYSFLSICTSIYIHVFVGRIESYGSHYDLDATGQRPPGREVQQCCKISIPFGTRYQQQQAARANVQRTHHHEAQFSV